MLFDWVEAHRQNKITGTDSKAPVSAERMEISRLRVELARVKRGLGFSGKSDDAPGERIAPRSVNFCIHPAGRPINTSLVKGVATTG